MMRDPLDMQVVRYLAHCQWPDGVSPTVAGSVPDTMPDRLVTVDQTGGSRSREGVGCLLSVWCWAGSRADAARLAQQTALLLENMPDTLTACASVDVQAVARLPYPGPPWRERYTLTVMTTWAPDDDAR